MTSIMDIWPPQARKIMTEYYKTPNFPSLQLSGSSPPEEAEGGREAGGGWRLRSLTEFSLRPFYLVGPQTGQGTGRAHPGHWQERPGIYLLENIAENKTFYSSQMFFIQFWNPVKLHSNDMENYVRLSQLNLYYLYSGYGMEYPRYLLIMLICNLIWVTE